MVQNGSLQCIQTHELDSVFSYKVLTKKPFLMFALISSIVGSSWRGRVTLSGRSREIDDISETNYNGPIALWTEF